jgi:hypothetical protein
VPQRRVADACSVRSPAPARAEVEGPVRNRLAVLAAAWAGVVFLAAAAGFAALRS